MMFAKPPHGFGWAESERATSQITQILDNNPELQPFWGALKQRLIHTGHREGTPVRQLNERNAFVFSAELDDLPTIQIVYTILGSTLTAQSVRVVP